MTLGEKIKAERLRRNLSLRALSLKCKNTSHTTIARIEKGLHKPGYNTLKDIAQSLNLDLETLFDAEKSNKSFLTLDRLYEACQKNGVEPAEIENMSQDQLDTLAILVKQFLKK